MTKNEIGCVKEIIYVNNLISINGDIIELVDMPMDENKLYISIRDEKKYGNHLITFELNLEELESVVYSSSKKTITLKFFNTNDFKECNNVVIIIVSDMLNLL